MKRLSAVALALLLPACGAATNAELPDAFSCSVEGQSPYSYVVFADLRSEPDLVHFQCRGAFSATTVKTVRLQDGRAERLDCREDMRLTGPLLVIGDTQINVWDCPARDWRDGS